MMKGYGQHGQRGSVVQGIVGNASALSKGSGQRLKRCPLPGHPGVVHSPLSSRFFRCTSWFLGGEGVSLPRPETKMSAREAVFLCCRQIEFSVVFRFLNCEDQIFQSKASSTCSFFEYLYTFPVRYFFSPACLISLTRSGQPNVLSTFQRWATT